VPLQGMGRQADAKLEASHVNCDTCDGYREVQLSIEMPCALGQQGSSWQAVLHGAGGDEAHNRCPCRA
jgi:hypothetical protein